MCAMGAEVDQTAIDDILDQHFSHAIAAQ